jgi:hypothetical protein
LQCWERNVYNLCESGLECVLYTACSSACMYSVYVCMSSADKDSFRNNCALHESTSKKACWHAYSNVACECVYVIKSTGACVVVSKGQLLWVRQFLAWVYVRIRIYVRTCHIEKETIALCVRPILTLVVLGTCICVGTCTYSDLWMCVCVEKETTALWVRALVARVL